jgi:hypothetical protein
VCGADDSEDKKTGRREGPSLLPDHVVLAIDSTVNLSAFSTNVSLNFAS